MKFDLDIHADSVEGLVVRDKITEKGNGNGSKNRSKSKNPHAGKTCNYYGKLVILLLTIDNCKRRGRKKKIILMNLLKLRLLNLIMTVMFCLLPLLKGGAI